MASSSECTQGTLICPICYEDYNKTNCTPMVLGKCGHTICLSCLKQLTSYGRVRCPKCRVITGSSDVNVNYDLRTAATHNRGQEKEDCEKEDSEKEDSEKEEQESCNNMTNWLAAGAVVAGAAVFGITGFALGRTSNRPR
ncbi:E3 ubiquitin-protein ligase RNF166-like [Oratosquilla oratoria]|uniref:E3 ubiquitin-protein ligase RNF166-like n=1 Tax=Oratosquilla oratoria TaxID=337810 RepID=UPI003F767E61